MATVLEQLKADYEASTQGEWIEAEDKSICVPYVWMVADFVPQEADRRHVIGAHNRFPLLLAVTEAVVSIMHDMTPIDHPTSPTDYAYGMVTNEQWRALVVASAPLLEETDA